jgi:hypothetical protein
MKSSIFRDITPYNPLKVNGRFGGTFRLNFQGRNISQARNQHEFSTDYIELHLSMQVFGEI